MQNQRSINSQILAIALPAIATNITVPLLSLCDAAIVGHLGSEVYIGAIAVGGMCFNIIYWLLGIIRMTASGLTAQAFGAGDERELSAVLQRSLVFAAVLAAIILVLQQPFLRLCLLVMSPSEDVAVHASTYFRICVWGAPAVLCQYALCGSLLGRQNARYPLYIAVIQNVANILLSLCFVFVFRMKVDGVALGTVLAQYVGLAVALLYCRSFLTLEGIRENTAVAARWRRMLEVNGDLFLRTVCMVAVTLFFTSVGSRQSDTILAVNSLLMQFFMFFSYFTDGFAFAGEAMCGKYEGAGDAVSLRSTVRGLMAWGAGITVVFTLLYAFCGAWFLSLLTDRPSVLTAAEPYWKYVVLVPVTGFAAFLWDGIMVGLTMTRQLLWATLSGMAAFAVTYLALPLTDINAVLWIAFLAYLALRSVSQCVMYMRR